MLLVDDEPVLLSTMRRVIEEVKPNATVVYASDPDMALWQIETTSLRLVITDMQMGGKADAGWVVVRAALAAGVKVAVVSGRGIGAMTRELARMSVPFIRKDELSISTLTPIVLDAFADP